MNIYLLTNNVVTGYDTYDSCVVVAKDEESARLIHPSGYDYDYDYVDWCKPEEVEVKLIGTTETEEEGTVIIASFNAG